MKKKGSNPPPPDIANKPEPPPGPPPIGLTIKEQKMIRLGSKVKDVYSGIEGIAIGRTDWLYGCTRYGVETSEKKDGVPITIWFDEQRLSIVTEEKPKVSEDNTATSGGPKDDPSRNPDPVRRSRG